MTPALVFLGLPFYREQGELRCGTCGAYVPTDVVWLHVRLAHPEALKPREIPPI